MTGVELFTFDRQVLRHYHWIALGLAAVNLAEAAGLASFTVDGLAWVNLAGALLMGAAWPLHESVVKARRAKTERAAAAQSG